MKNKHLFTYAIICCCLFNLQNVHAQTWVTVGSPGFSAGYAMSTSIAIDGSGTPYVAYQDALYSLTANVQKYDGSNWVYVGVPAFSNCEAYGCSIVINSSGTPYVAYQGFGGCGWYSAAEIMLYNGSSWVFVDSPYVPGTCDDNPVMALDNSGKPYIAFTNCVSDTVAVMKDSSGSLVIAGSAGLSGVQWCSSIAIDGSGTPYVAYEDSANGYKVTVMKYNGSSWITVGSAGFSAGPVSNTAMVIDTGGTPYVVYQDSANGARATVMKYNGSSWVNVGSEGFSAGVAVFGSNNFMAIASDGTPYVVYEDGGNSYKATVMKYNGSSWVNVGLPGFSAGVAQLATIAIDGDGTPYVAFADSSISNRATVMKLDNSIHTGVKNITNTVNSLTVFPNPNNGYFNLNLFSPNNEAVTITITNMIGEKVKELTTNTNQQTEIRLDNAPGMYFITTTTKSETLTGKIVVE